MLVTLPMPKNNINAQAIILMLVVWLLSDKFSSKFKRLIKHKYAFLSISVWFLLFIVGLSYSVSMEQGLKNIQKSAPLLVIPLIIFSTSLNAKKLNFTMKWFSISVICCALFALAKASYFTYMGLGNYFYNQNLAALLNIHTSYYSLFCVIVVLYLVSNVYQKKHDLFCWFGVLFLIIFMYLLSSRMAVFSLGIGGFVLLYHRFRQKAFLAIIPIGLVMLAFLFSPNFQKREVGNSQFGTTAPKLSTRILHWKAVIDAVGGDNILIGNGSGTSKEHVYDAYEKYSFTEGVLHKYNAHNQFLEHFIYFGLISILIWCFCFAVWIKNIFFYNPFLFASSIVIICFMFTESILERQHGIVTMALFISLTLKVKNKKNELRK